MNDIAAIASSPLLIQKERGAHRSPLRIVCTSRWRTASRHVVHIGSCMYRAIANERAKSWALALAMSMYMQFSIRRVAACIGFAPFQFRSVLVANTSTRTIECQARNPLPIIFGDLAQHICKKNCRNSINFQKLPQYLRNLSTGERTWDSPEKCGRPSV